MLTVSPSTGARTFVVTFAPVGCLVQAIAFAHGDAGDELDIHPGFLPLTGFRAISAA
jgi:hypothetical protein